MQVEAQRAELMVTAGQLEEAQAAEQAAAKESQQAARLSALAALARGRAAQLVSNAAMCSTAAAGAQGELTHFDLVQDKLKVSPCNTTLATRASSLREILRHYCHHSLLSSQTPVPSTLGLSSSAFEMTLRP